MTSKKKILRSDRWFSPDTMRAFAHRQRLSQVGHPLKDYKGKPVIGIINTYSEISTCHSHFPQSVKFIREGILRAGGFPLELFAMSLSEVMVKPTTMLYRNLLAMEVEELILSHPLDGVVLLGGCDKTIPGLLMGAFSSNLPAILVPAGATINGNFKGIRVGTGTHTRKYWDMKESGEIDSDTWRGLEEVMTRSAGTCNTMGTASTMACMSEAMGMTLANSSTTPAVDSAHLRNCTLTGERIVSLVKENITPDKIVTEKAIKNAIVAYAALGGSTNAVIHLIAMTKRLGIDLNLKQMDSIVAHVPVVINLMPAGKYLMEDFHHAGGFCALLHQLRDALTLSCVTVSGETMEDRIKDRPIYNTQVILPATAPVNSRPTLSVLYGNLCEDGAVIKPVAASEALLEHHGKAVVFENMEDMKQRINSPDLPVDASSVLVLKNAGPKGGPGMPEWGGLPIPKKLIKEGVNDMVRISDARMSGTHFGTCILHVSPEAFIGGTLALVKNGDEITLSLKNRSLHLQVSEQELAIRKKVLKIGTNAQRGWLAMYQQHVTQAHLGCDLDFMSGKSNNQDPKIS